MATNTIELVYSNNENEAHSIKPIEDSSEDEDINEIQTSPLTQKHKVSRSVSPKNNKQLEINTNKGSHNIKLKSLIAVTCIFCIAFLFGVGYLIYNGSNIVISRLEHNSATKEQCDFVQFYDYQNCTYSCNCGQLTCETCDAGIQYKYYALAVDKCGNDTILTTAGYTDCYQNRINSLQNLSLSVDCYVSDCDEQMFRFEYQKQDISNGIWWIVGGVLICLCPICCFMWFCKQYISYDLRR